MTKHGLKVGDKVRLVGEGWDHESYNYSKGKVVEVVKLNSGVAYAAEPIMSVTDLATGDFYKGHFATARVVDEIPREDVLFEVKRHYAATLKVATPPAASPYPVDIWVGSKRVRLNDEELDDLITVLMYTKMQREQEK